MNFQNGRTARKAPNRSETVRRAKRRIGRRPYGAQSAESVGDRTNLK